MSYLEKIIRARFYIFVLLLTLLLSSSVFGAEESSTEGGISYFQRFFVDGGPLVWLVLLPLSFITIGLIVQFFLHIRRARLMPADTVAQLNKIVRRGHYSGLGKVLQNDDSFLSRTLSVGLAEARGGRAVMENAMGEMLEQQSSVLFRKIEWLNIIGNVAPMIGLFGTVWGMIEAFNRIVRAHGQPEPDQLAGAISIAMVTTLWGLFAAIPALAAYGSLRNRIDGLSAEVSLVAEKVLRDFSDGEE